MRHCPSLHPGMGKTAVVAAIRKSPGGGGGDVILSEALPRVPTRECPSALAGGTVTLASNKIPPSVVMPERTGGKPMAGRSVLFFQQLARKLGFAPRIVLTPGGGFDQRTKRWTGCFGDVSTFPGDCPPRKERLSQF